MKKHFELGLFTFILISVMVLLYYFNLYKQQNIIIVNKNNLVQILDDIHNDIDSYLDKKIIISGYVYIQDDFSEKNFVIAHDIAFDSSYPLNKVIVGFLCENKSGYNFLPNDSIKIIGKIKKGYYNEIEYPLIEFFKYEFII